MDQLLTKIRDYADRAHGNQTRRYSSDRYIVHPVRVMEICRQYTHDTAMLAAALLHDVLEDTPVRKDEMEDFLQTILDHQQTQRTIKLVVELTDIYVKANYPQWNRRKRKSREAERLEKISAEAQTIKCADIIDNSGEIASHDPEFAEVYLYECSHLLTKIKKGNQQLYQRAIETVQLSLELLKR